VPSRFALASRNVRRVPYSLSSRHYARKKVVEPVEVDPLRPSGRKMYTPGPVRTSDTVRQAFLKDLGARDPEIIDMIQQIRQKILAVENFSSDYDCVIHEGDYITGMESVINSVFPENAKLLVVSTGTYGALTSQIAKMYNIDVVHLELSVYEPMDIEVIKQHMTGITHFVMNHVELANGMLQIWPAVIEWIQTLPESERPVLIADVAATYGVHDLPWAHHVDFLVTSASNGLTGPPGISVIIFNKNSEEKCMGYKKRFASLDFLSHWKSLEETGNFRGTPPTHLINAMHQAMLDLESETIAKRKFRFDDNRDLLVLGMISMGFKTFLTKALRSNVNTVFSHPVHANFNWQKWYGMMLERGFVLTPGAYSNYLSFGVATVGHLVRYDIVLFLDAVKATKTKMKF